MSSEMVQFPSNGGTAEGYLSIPASGTGAGVVVIQEWWGLVAHIKEVCDRFSSAGFVALAPDLYHGKTTKLPDEAGKLMMALKIDETEKDLRGAIRFLLDDPRVTSERVGTVGFCMGGALSLYAASKNEQVGACVVFYGGHPKVKPDLENLRAPVLGLYAGKDNFVTPEVVRELESRLDELGKPNEMHIYADADHAFFNDTRPEVYHEADAADAWRRTLDFFRANLEQATAK
jgi:carboxymethylenebutenolidase